MKNVPDSLPGRLFLLAYDIRRQRMTPCTDLGYVLRAAALADLYLNGHLTEESGRPRVFVRRPAPGATLDPLLRQIAESRPRSWGHWIRKDARAMVTAVRDELAADGWVRVERRRRFGVLPGNRITVRDPRVITRLTRLASGALRDGHPIGRVDPYDAATVALAAGGGLRTVLSRGERREYRGRIADLSTVTGPAAPALHKAIQRKRTAMAGGG